MPISYLSFEKPNLSIIEAAAFLGVGRSTLYGLIKAGKIHTFKIGKRTLVPRDELEQLIANARQFVSSARKAA